MRQFVGVPLYRWCIDAAAQASCTTSASIVSDWRAAAPSRARFVAYYLARHAIGGSYPAIGRAIGKRDHSAVWYGLRRADALMASDPGFAATARRAAEILLARLEAHVSR